MVKTDIIINDYSVDQVTGHVTVRVHSHSVDGNVSWDGPVKDYGVNADILRDRFGGDIGQFEAYVKKEHQAFSGAHVDLVDSLLRRKGLVIG